MSDKGQGSRTDELVREEAIAWLTRLRSPAAADEYTAFETWYAADVRHADIYDAVLDNWDRMILAGQTPAANMREQLGRTEKRHVGSRFAAVAAGLVLVLLTGLGGQQLGVFGGNPPEATEIASGIGEIRTMTLPDGSRVTLDTDSTLTIAYTDRVRRLELAKGRARFDVAHEPERPFVVSAAGRTVTARGTVFDVDVDGAILTVSLLQGSVDVRDQVVPPSASASAAAARTLQPGQRLSLSAQKPLGSPVPLAIEATRWPDGLLFFENEPLADVVAAANRYSTAQIVLSGPTVANLQFTGTLKASDPGGFARILAATFDLSLSRRGTGDVLLAQRQPQEKEPG